MRGEDYMQIRGKLFPYPILNKNEVFSNFIKKSFDLIFDNVSTDDKLILHNVTYVTDASAINELIKEGKVGVVLIVECADTIIRKTFDVTNTKIDITISNQELNGKVEFSLFAYAKFDFEYCPSDVDEDYNDITFQIEKYDILCVNDGVSKIVLHKDAEESLVKSIFSIQSLSEMADGLFDVQYKNSKKILISMSEYDHANYNVVYSMPIFQEVFFNMILIPALSQALTDCFNDVKNGAELDDIIVNYQWFASILKQYQRLKGEQLTIDIIKNIQQPIAFAQEILGKPIKSALEKLIESTKKQNQNAEEE